MNVLCGTISLLWISIGCIGFCSHRTNSDCGLMTLLVCSIFCSYWFWMNPIKNSLVHTIDALVAKICIGTFILYTLFIKEDIIYMKLLYTQVLAYIGLAGWYSHRESNRKWCGEHHIRSHAFLHFFCFVATFFAI